MNDIKSYIESGILELYVTGSLTPEENQEIYALIQNHPEIKNEVEQIEETFLSLGKEIASSRYTLDFDKIKKALDLDGQGSIAKPAKKVNFTSRLSWAASIILGGALLWSLYQSNNLQQKIEIAQVEQKNLKENLQNKENEIAEANNFINILKDKNVINVPLAGQGEFKETYAQAYWDKTKDNVVIDIAGLPAPPEGKVYQVWSLTLDPLTPTSLGTIETYSSTQLVSFKNANSSQAFGITLEPKGGSATPTMDQLYTLGVVAS